MSVPQKNLDNRPVYTPAGKALGGGTVINGGAWVRGHRVDYDLWAEIVGDQRWSYNGQLPYMKKTESFFDHHANEDQHGYNGPMIIEGSSKSNLPMREHLAKSYEALGVHALPHLDANAGDSIGFGQVQSNRKGGRRQIAAEVYPLEGIAVLTNTMVEKVLVKKTPGDNLAARGVQLANGTKHSGDLVVLAAGAYRTPQLLMLSGIGPLNVLEEHGIQVMLDQEHVGQHMHDHVLIPTVWKVKTKSAVLASEVTGYGGKIDFIATTSLPKDGLRAAIAKDEGAEPTTHHPMLSQERASVSHSLQYTGPPGTVDDGSLVMSLSIVLITTSRGSVGLSSASINDSPLIDPNYLSSETDRYAAREALRFDTKLLGSDATIVGREILDGEFVMPGQKPLTIDSTDNEIDERVRMAAGSCWHPSGTASMGKVVDTNLRVKGVEGLFVVDSSVFPISVSANLQVAIYALAMQAAEIIVDHL